MSGSHVDGFELPIARQAAADGSYPPEVTRVPCTPGACVVFTECLYRAGPSPPADLSLRFLLRGRPVTTRPPLL